GSAIAIMYVGSGDVIEFLALYAEVISCLRCADVRAASDEDPGIRPAREDRVHHVMAAMERLGATLVDSSFARAVGVLVQGVTEVFFIVEKYAFQVGCTRRLCHIAIIVKRC